jgi:predicted alpha/beta hydrolase family esterase
LIDFNFDIQDFVKDLCTKKITLYHSTDDPVVPCSNSGRYYSLLLNSQLIILERKGHRNQASFPEIIEAIKSLSDGYHLDTLVLRTNTF